MEIKIAIPINKTIEQMVNNFENIKEQFNLKLFKLEEEKCTELLVNNRVDAAILSPLSYGKLIDKQDFRIIPLNCLSAKGFTGLASINFKENLDIINTIATDSKNNFYTQIGLLLLKEKFDIDPKLIEIKDLDDEVVNSADAVITLGMNFKKMSGLDVTEEWYDSYEMPLPLAFWVCRAEEHPANIEQIINILMTPKSKKEQYIRENSESEKEYFHREGSLLFDWNQEIENSLSECLKLFYYHQLFPAIPAVKVLGKDIVDNNDIILKIDACELPNQ